jgi:hypothetical protein
MDKEITTEQDIVSSVLKDFQKAYKAKQPKEQLFREIYRRYRSYLEVSQTTTRSSLFIPESFTLVETVAPRLTARKPSYKAIPRRSSAISKADSVGYLLDYRYDVMGLEHKNKLFAKQGLKYGTSVKKMGWDSKKKMPASEVIDIADLFPDPCTSSWKNGFIIHRYWMTPYELENSSIKYKNIDQLKNREESTVRDDQMRQDRNATQGIPVEPNHEGFEVLEWWGRVNGEIRIRSIADRSVLIRDDKSELPIDEYPFIVFFDQEVEFEKWGIGEIEPILDLQDEENTIRNQRIDEKNLSIHNMFVVSKTAGIDYKTLISKPGGIILANDINGIKPLDKQNITQDSVQEIQLIKQDIQNTTGVNDYIRGTGSANSATETVSKTQEANQRFADKVNNFEMALKEEGRWIVALDAAFLTDDLKLQIMGKYGLEEKILKLEDIKDEFDIDIETGSSLPANPDLRRQQLRELLQVIFPILSNPNGIPDGLREFLRTLIQSYDLKNADEILQGAVHPEISRVNSQLEPSETEGVNPQMLQEAIKRKLMQQGALAPIEQGQQTQQPPMRNSETPLPVQ